MASKTYPLTWGDDEQRERWQKAADAEGVSLAQWIRDAGEMRLKGLLVHSAEAALPEGALSETGKAVHAARGSALGIGAKKSYEPNWKGGKKP